MITETDLKNTKIFNIIDLDFKQGSITQTELKKIAIGYLKQFHKIGIDTELKISDLKGYCSLLNCYVYLLNIGCKIELTKQDKKSFYFYENRNHYINNCGVLK